MNNDEHDGERVTFIRTKKEQETMGRGGERKKASVYYLTYYCIEYCHFILV